MGQDRAIDWAQELGLFEHHREDGLARLVKLLAGLSNSPLAALWVIEDRRQFIASDHGDVAACLRTNSTLGRRAASAGGVLEIRDLREDPELFADAVVSGSQGLRFFASNPVKARNGQAIGVLCIMDSVPRALDAPARAALEALSELLEDRLQLRSDVRHDPQTGALTRHEFEDVADKEWRRAMRAMVPLSLIVSQLDEVPGASGHDELALDRGIRAATLAMQYSVHRPGDCVARLDTNRFATLLYGTDAANSTCVAERVRLSVEALQIPLSGQNQNMSLSQGITSIPAQLLRHCDLGQALRIADKALAQAIAEGGNRWQVASIKVDGAIDKDPPAGGA